MLYFNISSMVNTQIGVCSGIIILSNLFIIMWSDSVVATCHFLISTLAILSGCLLFLFFSVLTSPKYSIKTDFPNCVKKFQTDIQNLAGSNPYEKSPNSPLVVMNARVSTTLQNFMDLVFRDLVEPAIGELSFPGMNPVSIIKNDAWEAVFKFYSKISKIDPVQFLTQDVVLKVTQHLEKIRLSQSSQENKERCSSPYSVSSFLENPQSELELLRKLADVLVANLLPQSYIDCLPLRKFFRELLACQVLQPGISFLCDPDTINQQLVHQLHLRQIMKRNCAYAASYEEFVSFIEECDDSNELQQLRCNLATEIAQATAINSVKRSKCPDFEHESIPTASLGMSKVNLLQARNLKRYITQLTCAKLQCERRLRILGSSMPLTDMTRSSVSTSNFVEDAVPSFKTVMRNAGLRHQLETYLAQQGANQVGLLNFWVAIQQMRRLERKESLTLAAQIFYNYICTPSPILKVDKTVVKGMESFLVGDRGPECFFQAQDLAWKMIEERHYPSFLVVLACRMTTHQRSDCLNHLESGSTENSSTNVNPYWNDAVNHVDSDKREIFVEWNEQTNVAQMRMEQLDCRLNVKLQALGALRNFAPSDKTLLNALEREVESLQTERRELESWLHQTETWISHIGRWKATVAIPQNSDDKEYVRFPVEVHLEGEEDIKPSTTTSVSRKRVAMSWTVRRQVAEFYALYDKLTQQCAWLKSAQLPALSGKTLFGKPNDRAYLEGAVDKLQSFLDAIMSDDQLNVSEDLFMFLHNPPACLRPSANAPKKTSRFFFATLFKGDAIRESDDDIEHESVPVSDEIELMQSVYSDDTRDGIAEPIYHLISEVFELRGVFGWLRRTLVTFVQITYGRTINRQLREVISNLFTDQTLLNGIQSVVKIWWPNGLLLPSTPERTAQEKRHTKLEARALLTNNIPDVLSQLLGQQNVRRGVLKVWSALQDERLNKQLVYDIIDVIMREGFPESSIV